MKFLVDQTMGRLAKWLRLMGFDVRQIRLDPHRPETLPPPAPEAYIITGQAYLRHKAPRPDLFLVRSRDPKDQLTEICRWLPAMPETWEPLSRCPRCNQTLLPLAPEVAADRVPEYISQKHQQFFECPGCQRVFWEGSHQRRIQHRLQELRDRLKNT
ncbi:MAG: hypothetical protein FJ135_04745 [Deltaproteobacteria bacterium]|nr:hypothetical protein [Deltaproteobacteria bacterium]